MTVGPSGEQGHFKWIPESGSVKGMFAKAQGGLEEINKGLFHLPRVGRGELSPPPDLEELAEERVTETWGGCSKHGHNVVISLQLNK